MDLSKIKKIVLEEGRVVIIDGEDALVVVSFEEYKKLKNLPAQSSALPKVEAQETKVIPADDKPETNEEPESPEETKSELTLDDLPF